MGEEWDFMETLYVSGQNMSSLCGKSTLKPQLCLLVFI